MKSVPEAVVIGKARKGYIQVLLPRSVRSIVFERLAAEDSSDAVACQNVVSGAG